MFPDVVPKGGSGWTELGSMEWKSNLVDTGSAVFVLNGERV
jgi:hypothetical protein